MALDFHSQHFVDHACSASVHELARIGRADYPRATLFRLRCSTTSSRPGHIGELLPKHWLQFTWYVWTGRKGHRHLHLRLPIDVVVHRYTPPREARTYMFEDFSGSIRERPSVQLNLSPRD